MAAPAARVKRPVAAPGADPVRSAKAVTIRALSASRLAVRRAWLSDRASCFNPGCCNTPPKKTLPFVLKPGDHDCAVTRRERTVGKDRGMTGPGAGRGGALSWA
ncbi:hypothetical protein NBRC116599_14540 [Aquicoccus sp. SU-CL01552]